MNNVRQFFDKKEIGKLINGTLSIVILKPNSPGVIEINLLDFCKENNLRIIFCKKTVLQKHEIIALYPDIFNFMPTDTVFGVEWKYTLIEYMSESYSKIFFIEGNDSQILMEKFKITIRDRYGKITHPKTELSKEEFNEKVLRNLIHVVNQDHLGASVWSVLI